MGLIEEDPSTSQEPMTREKQALLRRRGDVGEFLAAWSWAAWNHLRVRCVGAKPVITTWVNGFFVAEIDLGAVRHPDYDADEVLEVLGPRGHLALEVHDNDPDVRRQPVGTRRELSLARHPDPDSDRRAAAAHGGPGGAA